MRNISFALTEEQVLNQTKDVTRRLKWLFAKPGDVLQPVRKSMGLKRGESIVKLGPPIRLVSVTREPLSDIVFHSKYGPNGSANEARREGFPEMTGTQFVEFFCRSMKVSAGTVVTRLEFEYLKPEPAPLLAELVFYGAHNYGNHVYCGRCGAMCGREGCHTCDGSGEVDGEACSDCLGGERFWCDDCGEIEGWLPEGQSAPVKKRSRWPITEEQHSNAS